jgi:hypothetical protein
MKIIKHHAGDGELEPLNFELAGVFALTDVINTHGMAEAMAYMRTGHPTRAEFRPSLVVSVAPELKVAGRNDIPFGVFMATREANPESKRPLRNSESLAAYRAQFPVLVYDLAWQCWEDVVAQFVPTASVVPA